MIEVQCTVCSASFVVKPYRAATARFCSSACWYTYKKNQPRKPLADRFWPKVLKKSDAECWQWTAGTDGHGYGAIALGGSNHITKAHRVSWTLHNGPLSSTDCVLHICDNRLCVNPKHLFLGDRKDNMADKIRKGRQTIGSQYQIAKLNEDVVREIRASWPAMTQTALSKRYEVDQSTISRVVRRKAWAHVD